MERDEIYFYMNFIIHLRNRNGPGYNIYSRPPLPKVSTLKPIKHQVVLLGSREANTITLLFYFPAVERIQHQFLYQLRLAISRNAT